jgi:mono/diheme cytochrome c family protein
MWQFAGIAMVLLAGGSAPPDNASRFQAAAVVQSQHCVRCHNADKTRGGLDLSTRDMAFQGGATSDAIVPGQPDKSALLERAASGSMPPEKDGRRLNAEEVAALRQWIEAGASWPENATLPLSVPQARLSTPPQVTQPALPTAPRKRPNRPYRYRYGRWRWR